MPFVPNAGEVAVIWVSELTVNWVAAKLPKRTLVAPVKPLPEMTTEVPPPMTPIAGLSPVTAGTAAVYVNWSLDEVADDPLPVVTR